MHVCLSVNKVKLAFISVLPTVLATCVLVPPTWLKPTPQYQHRSTTPARRALAVPQVQYTGTDMRLTYLISRQIIVSEAGVARWRSQCSCPCQ